MPSVRDDASATIEGGYRFTTIGGVPQASSTFDETDRVTFRFDHRTSFVGVVGAGVRHDFTPRWGLRVDGRVFLGRNSATVEIDSSPSFQTGNPGDFIETFTNPSIQFSNNPSTGRQSSLSAPGLDGFEVVKADRFQARVLFTVGLFVRF